MVRSNLFLQASWKSAPDFDVFTDASGSLGFAYWQGQWFSGQCVPHQQPIKILIAWQGLFVIVLAARVWGGAWSHNKILFHCDNLAVVEVWEKQSMRDKALMQLV